MKWEIEVEKYIDQYKKHPKYKVWMEQEVKGFLLDHSLIGYIKNKLIGYEKKASTIESNGGPELEELIKEVIISEETHGRLLCCIAYLRLVLNYYNNTK